MTIDISIESPFVGNAHQLKPEIASQSQHHSHRPIDIT